MMCPKHFALTKNVKCDLHLYFAHVSISSMTLQQNGSRKRCCLHVAVSYSGKRVDRVHAAI